MLWELHSHICNPDVKHRAVCLQDLEAVPAAAPASVPKLVLVTVSGVDPAEHKCTVPSWSCSISILCTELS